ncbi:hypothetical protein B0H13DRAFT_1880382 [Mycena leptocephala]|nr:hypothetical protein B0H13DRAFT_1880382 [Mycena leptocephala]
MPRVLEAALQHITCVPTFIPEVDHDRHSKGSKTSYYVVAAGWVPAIYTNSQLADDQIRGFANFVRESYATKEQALKAWNTFCQNHHGNRCPNAARTFWGIKGLTAMFESRDEAIQFADSVGLMTINLFGSTDENEVRSFVRLSMA